MGTPEVTLVLVQELPGTIDGEVVPLIEIPEEVEGLEPVGIEVREGQVVIFGGRQVLDQHQ